MKTFIAHVNQDKALASRVAKAINDTGHQLVNGNRNLKQNTTIDELLDKYLNDAELIVVIVSENYLSSQLGGILTRTIALREDFSNTGEVIVVLSDHARLPIDLIKYQRVLTYSDLEGGMNYLAKLLADRTVKNSETVVVDTQIEKDRDRKHQIDALSEALEGGSLTLVCGAGVSADSGLPQWDDLLDKLLADLAKVIIPSEQNNNPDFKFDVSKLKANSTLIVGQYIKNTLGDSFAASVQRALYSGEISENPLLTAISQLAMPRRAGKPLDSIITFNFDDLLENHFGTDLKHRSIFSEGQRHDPNELPIYHVHGFLPRSGKVAEEMNIVFSEDAYHDQFIDPFSWSNLIQLSKYGQNTCLFVGISLSDPNLRRLLDVSQRKDTVEDRRHYLIQKRSGTGAEDKILDNLRSADASALGLSIIWVNEFEEIPSILESLSS